MADKAKAEQKKVEQPVEKADVVDKKSKTTLIWLVIVAVLVINTAGLYWLWNQQNLLSVGVSQQLSQTQNKASGDVKQLKQLIQKEKSNTKQQLATFQTAQNKFSDDLTALQDSQQLTSGSVQKHWALAEVQYLLNIANQRILFARDVAGAQAALTLADERVKTISDYRLHPLRALIAEELLTLESVADIDVEGMALQLQSALNNVDKLQLITNPSDNNIVDESAEQNLQDWQTVADQAWQEIKSMVVIRHQQDGAATVVLVPEQRYFLYQNLKLKLETARFALLQGKASVFDASLKSAAQWLEQYFSGDERDAMLALVTKLQSQKITAEMPDITASLNWIKGFKQ